MRNPTEMMKAILKSWKGQEIIDYVSPIYGESYVGLWIFEAIGTVMGELCDITDTLRYETNPVTADILLDYWEDHYGLPRAPHLTKEQRRARLLARTQSGGPCNPIRLAAAVSGAINGVPVDIIENTAKNTFLVIIREVIPSLDVPKAVLDQRKPAHLIYDIVVTVQITASTETKTAVATTHAERYQMDVLPFRDFPPPDTQITTAVAATYYEKTHVEVTQ